MSDFQKCYEYAIKYISRYPKTEHELILKLREKHFGEEAIQKTVEKLKKQGYIDDEKFVELYIGSELVKKGKPEIVVINKLIAKGVKKDLIQRKIREFDKEIKEGITEKISKEIEKLKKKGINGFDIIQKLLRKGYRLNDIKKTIEKNKE